MTPQEFEREFGPRIVRSRGDCWLLVGKMPLSSVKSTDGQAVNLRRLAHEVYVGEIPEGFAIKRLCTNDRCVSPDHLVTVRYASSKTLAQRIRHDLWGLYGIRLRAVVGQIQVWPQSAVRPEIATILADHHGDILKLLRARPDYWWPPYDPSEPPRVPIDQVVWHLGWRVKLELLDQRDLIYFDDQRRLSPVTRLAITERKAEILDWLSAPLPVHAGRPPEGARGAGGGGANG